MSSGYTIEDFRFSGSYGSRYHSCPGSAVLAEAIPGFRATGEERTATTRGTRLHSVFAHILTECEDLTAASTLLRELSAVRGQARVALLKDKRAYITWWFLAHHEAPPVEYEVIQELHETVPGYVQEDNETGATTTIPAKEIVTSPLLLRFLADAVQYIEELLVVAGPRAKLFVEQTKYATWTHTRPRTQADVVVTNGKQLWVIDLKTGSIPAEAAANEQLLYYVQTYRERETTFEVVILQPKQNSVWAVTPEYLERWTASVLEAEQRILAGDRSLVPGAHCQFCPANPYSKGDRGAPSCPAQVEVLFGTEDLTVILED